MIDQSWEKLYANIEDILDQHLNERVGITEHYLFLTNFTNINFEEFYVNQMFKCAHFLPISVIDEAFTKSMSSVRIP